MKKEDLHLYRRRYIPNEKIFLKDDKVLFCDEKLLITKWTTLNPKTEFAGGVSAFFIDKGWKVSKIIDYSGKLMHWYCDIIDSVIDEETNSYTYEDLLFDVVVYPDGRLQVLDCDEAAEAREKNLISEEQLLKALKSMNTLLKYIYRGKFSELQNVIEKAETEDVQ